MCSVEDTRCAFGRRASSFFRLRSLSARPRIGHRRGEVLELALRQDRRLGEDRVAEHATSRRRGAPRLGDPRGIDRPRRRGTRAEIDRRLTSEIRLHQVDRSGRDDTAVTCVSSDRRARIPACALDAGADKSTETS